MQYAVLGPELVELDKLAADSIHEADTEGVDDEDPLVSLGPVGLVGVGGSDIGDGGPRCGVS